MHIPAKSLILAALVSALATPALAQTVSKPSEPQAKKVDDRGIKAFEAGVKAFNGKKFDQAVSSLSTALSAGGLSSQQMAEALYYRGTAYRRQGKAAQAIADLTSSVWLKNGLGESLRAAAMSERAAAYQEAGLGEATPVGSPPLDQAPARTAAAPTESVTSSWQPATSAAAATAASTPVVSSGPVSGGSLVSPPADTALSALPGQDGSAASSEASLGGVGTALSNAGASVGGFFSNMFGGGGSGQQATAAPSASVETAATGGNSVPPAAPLPWAGTTDSAPVTSGWATTAAPTSAERKAKVAAVDPSAAAPAASGGPSLYLSAVRSREEAERMAKAVATSLPNAVGGVTPTIDEVVYGNMGKFFRVRLGPYASNADADARCRDLKPHGYDCVLVK